MPPVHMHRRGRRKKFSDYGPDYVPKNATDLTAVLFMRTREGGANGCHRTEVQFSFGVCETACFRGTFLAHYV